MDTGCTVIAMAYPRSLISLEGMWYKKPLKWLGISHNDFVHAGHAALCYVDHRDGRLYYADFGRYITPYGHGRMRSLVTDPDVEFDFVAKVRKQKVEDLEDLLAYVAEKEEATHGTLPLYASTVYTPDGDRVRSTMERWIQEGCVPYGPIQQGHSNCSRFVWQFVKDSLPSAHPVSQKLKKSYWLTPSTLSNVMATSEDGYLYRVDDHGIARLEVKSFKDDVLTAFFKKPRYAPARKNNWVPKEWNMEFQWQWLGGTGSGAWFRIAEVDRENARLRILCKGETGSLLFDRWFSHLEGAFPEQIDRLVFDYESNARVCTLRQGNKTFQFLAEAPKVLHKGVFNSEREASQARF